MMAPIVGFVFILCACMSISGVYSLENCPDSKYPIDTKLVGLPCTSSDPCGLITNSNKVEFEAYFNFKVPEDISDVYYNVSMVGKNINAGSSGKAKTEVFPPGSKVKGIPKNSLGIVDVSTKLEGNMPDGEKGVLTVKLYFNEEMKDTPDICVTTNIFLEVIELNIKEQ